MVSLDEQRLMPRISVDIPVKIKYTNDKTYLAQIVSISQSGFLCLMKRTLPPQTNVDIIMLIPSINHDNNTQSSKVSGKGIIVRENMKNNFNGDLGHVVAVKFTEIQSNFDLLKKFIEYYLNNNN